MDVKTLNEQAITAHGWSDLKWLKRRLNHLWNKGEILSLACEDQSVAEGWVFLNIPLRHPTAEDEKRHPDAARAFSSYWKRKTGKLSFERTDCNKQNSIPVAVFFDSAFSAAEIIGKTAALRNFLQMRERFVERFPKLSGVFKSRPLEMLKNRDHADLIMALCEYLVSHPRPGIYIHETDIRGISSAFIEKHCRVLGLILDEVLPADSIDESFKAVSGEFEQRYGFKHVPPRVRLRLLCPEDDINGREPSFSDLEVDITSFCAMTTSCHRFLICENETVYLTLPVIRNTMALCANEHSYEALREAKWLRGLDVVFWGNLSLRGFCNLARLRQACPLLKIRSVMMDPLTFNDFQDLLVEDRDSAAGLSEFSDCLTDAELESCRLLQQALPGKTAALPQELITCSYSSRVLKAALNG